MWNAKPKLQWMQLINYMKMYMILSKYLGSYLGMYLPAHNHGFFFHDPELGMIPQLVDGKLSVFLTK